MQLNDKIKESLGNWWEVLTPLITSDTWDSVFRFLKQQKSQGKVICPVSNDLFKSFRLVDRHKMKALIILQDPYPTFRNEVMIADGVPLSCSYTKYHQPSLYMWHQQMEKEYGFHPDNDQRNDLSYLLEEEHVMLLNSALTTEKDKSGSHQSEWHPIMRWYIENVINVYYKRLPIVLCGNSAKKLEQYINPMLHYIKCIEHPVVAAYANREWQAHGVFKWINEIIRQNNSPSEMVVWLRKKGETKKSRQQLPEWVTGKPVKEGPNDLPWDE